MTTAADIEPTLRRIARDVFAHAGHAAVVPATIDAAQLRIEALPGPTGGFSGEMRRYTLTYPVEADGSKTVAATVVVKIFADASLVRSKALGTAREGLFYQWFNDSASEAVRANVGPNLVKAFYAAGDIAQGSKLIVMADMGACASASHLYGMASPVNWGKQSKVAADVERVHGELLGQEKQPVAASSSSAAAATGSDKVDEAKQYDVERLCSFQLADACARMNAQYWHAPVGAASPVVHGAELADISWLRGRWFLLREPGSASAQKFSEAEVAAVREDWQSSIDFAKGHWFEFLKANATAAEPVKIDSRMTKFMTDAFDVTTWEAYVRDMAARSWTLVHGDYHPGNMLWRSTTTATESRLVIVDWEAVGFGNGPQELAQALISHAVPDVRRRYENEVLQRYTSQLEALGCIPPTDEARAAIRDEYVACGLGRWVWLLGVCAHMCPGPMVQYWHDQVLAFCVDHGVFDRASSALPVLVRP